MNFFHNILAVIEYKQVRQPALERALALYQYAKAHKKNADIKITAVLPVAQENWNITSILAVDKEEYEKSYREKLSNWLNAYLAINAMGVGVVKADIINETDVIRHNPDKLCRSVMRMVYDLRHSDILDFEAMGR